VPSNIVIDERLMNEALYVMGIPTARRDVRGIDVVLIDTSVRVDSRSGDVD
jgi:hypothetical protein